MMLHTPKSCWRLLMALAGLVLLPSVGVDATEDQFVYVDRMPAVEGKLTDEMSSELKALDIVLGKRVFTLETEEWVITSHVMSATCPGSGVRSSEQPYILAIQYLPRRPNSMAMAGLHDVYKDVYVEDRDGRVRLYQDMTGREMVDLTRRFRPACLPV